jgi:hypothetical protein
MRTACASLAILTSVTCAVCVAGRDNNKARLVAVSATVDEMGYLVYTVYPKILSRG